MSNQYGTMEDVNSFVCDIIDFVWDKLPEYRINIDESDTDEMFDALQPIIEKWLGYPEYSNHN